MVDFDKLHVLDLQRGEEMGYIYFLFHGKELIYIGQTVSLMSRVGTHRSSKFFTGVRYELCPLAKLTERETELILHYKPILNGISTKGCKERFKVIGNHIHVAGKGSFRVEQGEVFDKSERLWGYKSGNIICKMHNVPVAIELTKYNIETGESWVERTKKKSGYRYEFDHDTLEIISVKTESKIEGVPKSHVFSVGRYKGKLVGDIAQIDRQYVRWYAETVYSQSAVNR